MSQDKILAYWANLINVEYDKDRNFSLTDFLTKHHLFLDMLLVVPHTDISSALVRCKDIDVSKLKFNNKILRECRWQILCTNLRNHQENDPRVHKRIMDLFADDINCMTLLNANIGFTLDENYPVVSLFGDIIEYCDNNGTSIPVDVMKIVLNTMVRHFKTLDTRLIGRLIRYLFKHRLLEDNVFTELIDMKHTKLLIYAIKLYQSKSITFNNLVYFDREYGPAVWLLHQHIYITNPNKIIHYSNLNYAINTSAYMHLLLWLDDKQRFTNKKDLTLLHKHPMLVLIKEFLFK